MTAPLPGAGWAGYDVPALAAILTEDHALAWSQVHAWQQAYELLSYQQVRMSQARAELSDTWSPERSTAAATYLGLVDQLATSMVATGEAAIANGAALTGILSALSEAKTTIDTLHERWKSYAAQDRLAAQSRLRYVGSGTPHNWQAQLNEQARTHMIATDQTIFENTRRLTVPERYTWSTEIYSITPIPTPQAGTPSSKVKHPPAVRPPSAHGTNHHRPANDGETSPILAEPEPHEPPPVSKPPSAGPVSPPTRVPSSPPVQTYVGVAGAIGATAAAAHMRQRPAPATKSTSDTAQPGDITEPQTSESSAMSGVVSPGAGVLGRSYEATNERRRSSKRTTWALPKGVPAVIRREAKQPDVHDPGPGVIGIDR